MMAVRDSASLDLTGGMTLEAWIMPSTAMSTWQIILDKEMPGNTAYFLTANSQYNTPATGAYIGGAQVLTGGSKPAAGVWTHLASTYDGATQRLYVNGALVASRAQTGPIQVSTGVLRIGGDGTYGLRFAGKIDEVRVYNRALSATEIQKDMATPLQ
jgi:hypothetical protein